MNRYRCLFPKLPAIIGMVHVLPLPGTPRYVAGSFDHIIQRAKQEVEIYLEAGVDGILIENMHDIPYLNRRVGPEIIAGMTAVGLAVKALAHNTVCGIQILAGCNKEAIAVAQACGFQFIRGEGYVFAHIADEGFMQSDAGELLRYRKSIDAQHILLFTDIKKKHSSHALTSDLGVSEMCKAAEFFDSDGVVITGSSTGGAASVNEVKEATEGCSLPVIIGSGVTEENVLDYKHASGLIVGSYFKEGGYWENKLSVEKVRRFMKTVRGCR